MPWNERPLCWVPSCGETEEDGTRVEVSYEVDDPRAAAQLAAETYAERDFSGGDPFSVLDVRVKTDRGTFDVRVVVDWAPEFHASLPVPVTDDSDVGEVAP